MDGSGRTSQDSQHASNLGLDLGISDYTHELDLVAFLPFVPAMRRECRVGD